MRFGFLLKDSLTLWAWRRLQDEGHEVIGYHPPDPDGTVHRSTHIGDGIIERVSSLKTFTDFVGSKGVIIWEDNYAYELADRLRDRGFNVFGGGMFCKKLEYKRAYGERIAQEAGVRIPPSKAFKTISEAQAYVKSHPSKCFYFKPDDQIDSDATCSAKTATGMYLHLQWIKERVGDNKRNILQEKIEGTAVSTAWYWNGQVIVGPVEGTIEHKKYLNDELGPSTGCSFNLVWFYEDPEPYLYKELRLDKVAELFRREKAPPGMYDINAIIDQQGHAWFLEWTPRFGYDSEPTAQLLVSDLGELYHGMATGTLGELPVTTSESGSAYSFRLVVPPYPWEHSEEMHGKRSCVDLPVPIKASASLYKGFVGYSLKIDKGVLKVASPDGLLGLAATAGTNLEQMHKYCIQIAKSLDVPALGYRTDGDRVLASDLKAVRQSGVDDLPKV